MYDGRGLWIGGFGGNVDGGRVLGAWVAKTGTPDGRLNEELGVRVCGCGVRAFWIGTGSWVLGTTSDRLILFGGLARRAPAIPLTELWLVDSGLSSLGIAEDVLESAVGATVGVRAGEGGRSCEVLGQGSSAGGGWLLSDSN